MGRNDPAQMNEPPFAQVMLGGRSSGPSPGLNGGGFPTWGRCSTKRRRGQCHWPSRDAGRARSADASCLAEVLGMRFANTQVTTAAKVNNAMRWLATVTGCDRTLWYGVGRWARLWCGGPLAWFSMRVFSANPWLSWRIRRRLVGHRGVPCGRCTKHRGHRTENGCPRGARRDDGRAFDGALLLAEHRHAGARAGRPAHPAGEDGSARWLVLQTAAARALAARRDGPRAIAPRVRRQLTDHG